MAIGPWVRSLLGPYERNISEFYRAFFVDIKAFVKQTKQWVDAKNILELGCGEGACTELLVLAYPNSNIRAIDITPKIGRIYSADPSRVIFKQQTIQDFVSQGGANSVDLLILCDVIHHIPRNNHIEFLSEAKKAIKPEGYLVLKDWEYTKTPIHLLNYLADRYITGDRVQHRTNNEFRELLKMVFGNDSIKAETRIGPWSNNITFLVQV